MVRFQIKITAHSLSGESYKNFTVKCSFFGFYFDLICHHVAPALDSQGLTNSPEQESAFFPRRTRDFVVISLIYSQAISDGSFQFNSSYRASLGNPRRDTKDFSLVTQRSLPKYMKSTKECFGLKITYEDKTFFRSRD